METKPLTPPPRTALEGLGSALDEIVPLVDVVAVAGPPVVFVAAPWLLFGLMLAPPFAVALTLALLVVAATLVVTAIGALIVSPFLLLGRLRRHLRERAVRPATALPPVLFSPARVWPAGE